jgi:uncharacterized damage-inducible protein DinB
MLLAEQLLPEFDREMIVTRSLIELVPESKAAWQPHERSMTLGELAMHLASLFEWGKTILTEKGFDVNPPEGPGVPRARYESLSNTLERFEAGMRSVRGLLAPATDGELMVLWTLKNGGKTLFVLPRVGVFRSFFMNHMIHHRGQLSVYLRLCEIPLPPLYGPTADSPFQM